MSKKRASYHGPFFWLAIVSFSVPIVVAARAFHDVQLVTKPIPHPDASGVDHAIWDYLLKSYVENGLIDYDGMSRDHLLRTYVRELAEAKPDNLNTSADQLALLCNAYNAFVINGVVNHKIRHSVMDFRRGEEGFFDVKEHIFCGRTISLNELEHQWIRKRFQEPRVHVALVCAAASCPAIRAEAFVGRRLNRQLQDQSSLFANSSTYVDYQPSDDTLRLSPILDWYGDDWKQVGGYLAWLAARVKDPELKRAIERSERGESQIVFFQYDWSLNSQAPGEQTTDTDQHADFGSGTVPNGE